MAEDESSAKRVTDGEIRIEQAQQTLVRCYLILLAARIERRNEKEGRCNLVKASSGARMSRVGKPIWPSSAEEGVGVRKKGWPRLKKNVESEKRSPSLR